MIFNETELAQVLLGQGIRLKKSVEFGTGDGHRLNKPLDTLLIICPTINQNDKNLDKLKVILNNILKQTNGNLLPNEKEKIQQIIFLLSSDE